MKEETNWDPALGYEQASCDKEDQFIFLDQLRESGVTNMFGAGPYLVEEFGVSRRESHEILGEWMRTFEERHPKKEEGKCQ